MTPTTTREHVPAGDLLADLSAHISVPTTLAQAFVAAVAGRSGTALRYKARERAIRWNEISYAQLGERALGLARGLLALGIELGDRVAIISDTRPEWTLADYAAMCAGAVVAPVYQSNSPEECHYVLEHSDARVVFVEDAEQLAKVAEIRDRLPALEHVVMFEGAADGVLTLDALADLGRDVAADALAERILGGSSDDLFTLIYTSGTTGPPKGCMLTHGNFMANVEQVKEAIPSDEHSVFYVFLPLAHALTRMVQVLAISRGATLAYWQRDPLKLVEDLAEVKPTHLPCVPRVFEKIHAAAMAKVAEEGGAKEKVFHWAIQVGRDRHRAEHEGTGAGPRLALQHALADKAVFSKIRAMFGGRLEYCVSGGAPISPDILEFFHAVGIPIFEGFGMTECSAGSTFNVIGDYRFGTVGKPVQRCDIKIAADGEILIRGPHVFKGYFKNEAATEQAFVDGWLASGDLGKVDADGFVTITGRKKELIINAAGKNISPANIENELKQSPWISQAIVFGDRKPYLVALLALDPEAAPRLAEHLGVRGDLATIMGDDRVRSAVEADVAERNAKFARVEQVKRFALLPRELSQEEGEITPTMKTKRNVVYARYAEQFEALYR